MLLPLAAKALPQTHSDCIYYKFYPMQMIAYVSDEYEDPFHVAFEFLLCCQQEKVSSTEISPRQNVLCNILSAGPLVSYGTQEVHH